MSSDKRTITPAEERDLIASTERGEWRSVENIEERRRFLRRAAQGKLDQINIEVIRRAIKQRRWLSVSYKGSERSIEPYILGFDGKNHLLLSAVQKTGGSGKGFRTFRVSELSDVSVTDERFFGSHPDYNPRDPLFEEVVEKIAA